MRRWCIIAVKADALVRGLTDIGIVALVDEATGYQAVRPRDALQAYLEMILRRELAAWSKKFPEFLASHCELLTPAMPSAGSVSEAKPKSRLRSFPRL
jgi:hypothetical protein